MCERFSIEYPFDIPLVFGVSETISAAIGETDVPFVAGPAIFPPVTGGPPWTARFGDFAAGAFGLNVSWPKEFSLDHRGNRRSKTAERWAGGDF